MAKAERGIIGHFLQARRSRALAMFVLGITGPVLLVTTFFIFRLNADEPTSQAVRTILQIDLVYVGAVVLLVIFLTARLIRARQIGSAGSRLHLRLGGMFAALALLPTVLVALFAAIFFNIAIEGWFSDRVQAVVGSSLAAAEAYEREQKNDLTSDIRLLAAYLNAVKNRTVFIDDVEVRQALAQGQSRVQRGLKEAFIVDGRGDLILRGENSYLFNFERPSPDQLDNAATGGVILIEDWVQNEFRAIYQLAEFVDRYLYIAREVDGSLLQLLDETQETAIFYRGLQANSDRILIDFSLVYLFFAIVVTFSAILFGLWFAERLAKPVGELASAAARFGSGDFNVTVPERDGSDEISLLSRTFNQMTARVKNQRDDLLRVNAETEEARLLFDSVLSSVTAGVIGLRGDGTIEFVNDAAERLLLLDKTHCLGLSVVKSVPEFEDVWQDLKANPMLGALAEVKLSRSGKAEVLLVKITTRLGLDQVAHGYVVTFDDVTDLVSAQRMAAWGDVARRLAHEIKNPLTPIQLSAERLRRKFSPIAGEESESLDQYTNVIIRQAGDLRRIVDEFSKFARMPEPDAEPIEIANVISDVVLLQKNALPGVSINFSIVDHDLWAMADQGLIKQAVMNIVKNAGEAVIAHKSQSESGLSPAIQITLNESHGSVNVLFEDNGPGFPKADRSRLIEPYVTQREGGTGLGLSIVKKIVEQHGGKLELLDAKNFQPEAENGAAVRIRLPKFEPSMGTNMNKLREKV
ncbi:MAG: PAS domain-containing sensor histidine kinase [Pseudomonadota bacterium]